MLSILIPVYNFDVRPLVRGLQVQCRQEEIDFEILCFDDGSAEAFRKLNREIGKWPGVVYREMPENQGRARIRNLLAEAAHYEFLLFMDCDSGLVKADYIRTYVEQLDPEAVLYGGRVYGAAPPARAELYLHWLYGRQREQQTVAQRRREPYHGFMTNNFVIPKSMFSAIGFDERLSRYGHEDTLFGLELQRRGIPIRHLDNPLEHLGLETVEVFLEKTRQAIANLCFLYRAYPMMDTRLLRAFRLIKSRRLTRGAEFLLSLLIPVLLRNLHSAQPRLRGFDLYKMWLLLKEDKRS